ncbi:MAG: hypothetical protein RIA63_11770, partial [Cyclobacteriaceae bacterium]
KKPETLRSFQGVFLSKPDQAADHSLIKLSLKGNYLYTQVSGDPLKSIFDGYGAMFKYIEQHKVKLKSNTGYQISTFENGIVTTEIYMELE